MHYAQLALRDITPQKKNHDRRKDGDKEPNRHGWPVFSMSVTQASTQADVAVVYGSAAGHGGLGLQAANVLTALAKCRMPVHAFGPGHVKDWPLPGGVPAVKWYESPQIISPLASRYTWLRWLRGRQQLLHDNRLGCWAASEISRLKPKHCYVFTQVGLETLKWARRAGVPTVLDNPNGHIRNFREVGERESLLWCGKKYRVHPHQEMVERVEEEYYLADRIRVSSEWAKRSMVSYGVPATKIHVLHQPLNLQRFHPSLNRKQSSGPLRVCFVGALALHKGFIYLLRAIKMFKPEYVSLEIVGATGDRWCHRLFERERRGVMLKCGPGNPVPAYHQADVFVLPSLHDGFGFVVAEAMACGLPVIVTDACGAAEWVKPGQSGWVIPPGQSDALAAALEETFTRRNETEAMGRAARADVELLADSHCQSALRDWFCLTK